MSDRPNRLAELREEVSNFFATDYPQSVREKIASGQRLKKSDQILSQQALNAKGWLGVGWPKEDGGTGWSAVERYIFDQELDLAGAAPIIPMSVIYIGPILCAFGTEEQKARWLTGILESRDFWAQGYTEPESGSDLASLRLSAVRDGDDYVINGAKIWTSGAHWANWIFCLARTSKEARKQDGISMICVPMDLPGVTVHPIPLIDGSAELNRVEFDNVRVPAEFRIGDEGKGWHYANVLLTNERLSYAHIGAKRRDIERLRSRLAQWRECGEKAALVHKLAGIEAKLDVIETAILRVLGTDMEMATAAFLKIACTECAQAISALAVDIAGPGRAPMPDRAQADWAKVAPLVPPACVIAPQSYFFERAQTIYGGSTEIQKNILWRAISG
ncbi:MAG: acyl-CoA dehydrogenase family protein [Sphingorhabdus sp.]|uniref:acyl-CoA dehydrogenase family protein n=1 Tax=Sphingorhabdus sp. TaxID=1902408 RepID=UPI003C99646D